MNKYFTAVGSVNVSELKEEGHVSTECNFSHVVQANDADEAHEKVIDYYCDKTNDPYERFDVTVIEIFDFIS